MTVFVALFPTLAKTSGSVISAVTPGKLWVGVTGDLRINYVGNKTALQLIITPYLTLLLGLFPLDNCLAGEALGDGEALGEPLGEGVPRGVWFGVGDSNLFSLGTFGDLDRPLAHPDVQLYITVLYNIQFIKR